MSFALSKTPMPDQEARVNQGPGLSPAAIRGFRLAENMLNEAGLRLNGNDPWDIRIYDSNVPGRVLAQGNLGLGETYMAGHWDCPALDEFFSRLLRSGITDMVNPASLLLHALRTRLTNRQNRKQAWKVGERHYDLGNAFYERMLDPLMTYTCGYWKEATSLAEAQIAKLDLICRKLQLEPGMRVLDIGCGWGSFMAYAAENYGVQCVGVTISREQCDWAKRHHSSPHLDFRLQDYRDMRETFDRIVSIGMFEHVGRKNHRTYMEVAARCLEDDGLFLLHTICKNRRRNIPDPWIDRYIFPNGDLPSIGQIGDAVDGLFIVEDMHNFGADYDKTLMAWHRNFENAWPEFEEQLGERFRRMWRYYLLSCAGAFRSRDVQLWQWVLAKKGIPGGYQRPN